MPSPDDEAVDWAVANPLPKRGRGRPRKNSLPEVDIDGMPAPSKRPDRMERILARMGDDVDEEQVRTFAVRAESLSSGVNIAWLASAFRVDSRTVRKRLAGLKPLAISKGNRELFDFVQATTLLAPPDPDKFARWMRGLRTSDMPVQLQDTYWSAMRKRQIWEENAGELWKTDAVFAVLSEMFKTIKGSMQLWVDNLDPDGEMPSEARAKFQVMVDGLMDEIYQQMVSLPGRKQTPSSIKDPEVIINQIAPDPVLLPEDEDLI